MKCVIFDVETTGLSVVNGHRICEIGAVKIEGREIVDKFWSLVNPERQISSSAYLVNRIDDDMIKNAPKIGKVLPDFLKFSQGYILGAYNVEFDLGFVNNELIILGEKPIKEEEVFDVMFLVKKVIPHLNNYRLTNVAKYLKISYNLAHRALSDAIITAKIFLKLWDKIPLDLIPKLK